jgi:N-methylhydantoinase A/oxoprolinase/acetone carboxylase beta subunit
VFSALGLLLSPPRIDSARSVLLREEGPDLDRVAAELGDAVVREVRDSTGREPHRAEVTVDVRYLGQSHERNIPYRVGEGWGRLTADFHAAHRRVNGFDRPGDPIEVVTVRAAASADPFLSWDRLPVPRPAGPTVPETRAIAGIGEVPVWWRPTFAPGEELVGPGVIEEGEATIMIGAGDRAVVLDDGSLRVEW